MSSLSDDHIRAALERDAPTGWRAFIDGYTPLLLAQIERAGVRDHDEAMDVYVRVCERLSERDCERLRRHDPGKGDYGPWLAAVVRNVIVDWVRSRAGRRRLFGAVKALDPMARRVFELFYWEGLTPAEIAGTLQASDAGIDLMAVLDALERVDRVLTERHRSELVSASMRGRRPSSLDADPAIADAVADPAIADPETALAAIEFERRFTRALAMLPSEDAAILRLRYVQGLNTADVARALRLERLPPSRLRAIVERLRAAFDAPAGATETRG